VVAVVLIAGCATGRAMRNARSAADRGDWDAAVAYYREALGREPGRVDIRVALERAMREAATAHLARARTLEGQEQWAGAAAEYRLAAELEPSNALAASKAAEIEKKIRAMREAAQPTPRMEQLRQQAGQTSPIPRLDPRTVIPAMRFPAASVGEILKTISDLTGINITYDQNLEATLTRRNPPVDVQDVPLEEFLNQVMTANQLTFKVVNPRTIFVYQDTAQKRQQFEDQYTQTFYLTNADANEVVQLLNALLTTGPAVRPIITQNKSANSIVVRATAPLMKVIENIILSNDKPRAEVLIDVEILEVSRSRLRELGIDLSQWALGFTFSPELAPPNTPAAPGFPEMPPPINLNTLSPGVSARDFYMTAPSALIRLLESDTKTRLLAKPQLRGREGAQLTLQLGDDIPVPRTSFSGIVPGGVPTQPQVAYDYRPVGVNLTITPRVTYDDEIILDPIQVDRSAIGPSIDVGSGVLAPTFVKRLAQVSMRLRDGESNLLAGLVRDEERETARSLPGIARIPILRSLFGSSDVRSEETDVVMIVTPHIIRGRGLTPADLQPQYIGTGSNIGAGAVPTLISPDAPLPPTGGAAGTAGAPPAGATPPVGGTPPTTPPPAGNVPPPTPPRSANVVPIQPVTGNEPAKPSGATVVSITTPGTEFQVGGGPYPAPITISDVSQLSTITITVTYDPAVLRATTVTQGTFMSQGGVSPTFAPKIDAASGRVDIAISRAADQPGASVIGSQLLAAIVFQAVAPGSAQINVSAVATNASGQPIALQTVPGRVTVK
jgi:general secretion pathway protein D